jgi:hypothetical protein
VRTFTTNDDPAVRVVAEMALEAYKALRPRTVVLTFEKAKEIPTGSYAILDIHGREPRLTCLDGGGVDPSDGEYAYSEMPKLPGPEVFK